MSNRKRQMNLLLVIVCLFWFGQYVYIPYQTTYLLSIGVPSGITGLIIGAYGLVQIFFRIPAGILADTGSGHKKMIMAGVCCVSAASLFRVLRPDAQGFFVANLFSGLGASAWISYMVFYMQLGKDAIQAATGKIMAANNTGVFLGFVTSSLLYERMGMTMICLFSVVAGAIGIALVFGIREERPEKRSFTAQEWRGIFTYRRLLFFSVLAMLQQGVQMATCMSFTIQAVKELGATSVQSGIASIVYIVMAVAFSLLSGSSFFVKSGSNRVIPAGIVCQMVYCILVPAASNVYEIYGCQVLAAAAMGFLFTSLTSESMKGVPDHFYSTAMGIFQSVYAVGMTAFPILTGYIRGKFGLAGGYYFMAAMLGLGLIGYFVGKKKILDLENDRFFVLNHCHTVMK